MIQILIRTLSRQHIALEHIAGLRVLLDSMNLIYNLCSQYWCFRKLMTPVFLILRL